MTIPLPGIMNTMVGVPGIPLWVTPQRATANPCSWRICGEGSSMQQERTRRFHVHSFDCGSYFAAQWSPDGELIASGSTDITVQVWRAP